MVLAKTPPFSPHSLTARASRLTQIPELDWKSGLPVRGSSQDRDALAGTSRFCCICGQQSQFDLFLPDFALYDCYSCHHPLNKQRWSRGRAGQAIEPGTLHLQNYPFLILQAITEVLSPNELTRLVTDTNQLIRAGQKDAVSVRTQAQTLHGWIDTHDDWIRRNYSRAEIAQVRKTLLRYAADDKASDYITAEQIVLSVETLSYTLKDREARKAALESLFQTVRSSEAFDPTQFASVASGIQGRF
jgi:hypothetical protein